MRRTYRYIVSIGNARMGTARARFFVSRSSQATCEPSAGSGVPALSTAQYPPHAGCWAAAEYRGVPREQGETRRVGACRAPEKNERGAWRPAMFGPPAASCAVLRSSAARGRHPEFRTVSEQLAQLHDLAFRDKEPSPLVGQQTGMHLAGGADPLHNYRLSRRRALHRCCPPRDAPDVVENITMILLGGDA